VQSFPLPLSKGEVGSGSNPYFMMNLIKSHTRNE